MTGEVLVGVVRDERQLEANLKYGFYHIPAGNVADNRMPVQYVALYLSGATFKEKGGGVCYIGRVTKSEKLPRRDITEIPARYPDTVYYKFSVDKWRRLPSPVALHKKITICEFMELATLISKV